MKHPSNTAFTLIEMLVVMAVIAILASIILSINGFVQKKAALGRAVGEMAAMSAGCESYKADFGSYPKDQPEGSADPDTDLLCPFYDGDPNSAKYTAGNIALYKALSGDAKPGINPEPPAKKTDKPDGRAESRIYCEFRPNQLRKSTAGEVICIQDPFGQPYGYSTNGATAEEVFRMKFERNPKAVRAKSGGFNSTYDLWSTAGVNSSTSGDALDPDRKRWVKNW